MTFMKNAFVKNVFVLEVFALMRARAGPIRAIWALMVLKIKSKYLRIPGSNRGSNLLDLSSGLKTMQNHLESIPKNRF